MKKMEKRKARPTSSHLIMKVHSLKNSRRIKKTKMLRNGKNLTNRKPKTMSRQLRMFSRWPMNSKKWTLWEQ
jgi:hypothetical protein